MLRERVEAFANLSTMLDALTEEQATRIRRSVLGVRDLVIHAVRGEPAIATPFGMIFHDAK